MNKDNVSIETLDDHTWMISEGTGRGRTHCYLLEGNEVAILIDTGLRIINLKEITSSLTSKEVYVVNTHGHLDHIANNHQFSKVYMHPDDAFVLEEHRKQEVRTMFITQRYLDKGYTQEQLQAPCFQEELEQQAFLPDQVPFTPLHDHMIIDLGGRNIQIILTPGHTHGSICVLDKSYRRLYSGDTICEDGVLLHLPHSTSVAVYKQSLQKLKQLIPRFDSIYGGHQKVPLPLGVIDNFITCANTILQGEDHPIKNESAAGSGYRSTIQGVTLSYVPTNIQEEI